MAGTVSESNRPWGDGSRGGTEAEGWPSLFCLTMRHTFIESGLEQRKDPDYEGEVNGSLCLHHQQHTIKDDQATGRIIQ